MRRNPPRHPAEPPPKKIKTPHEQKEEKLTEIVAQFNKFYKSTHDYSAFVCYSCNRLYVMEERFHLQAYYDSMETAFYCARCVRKCKHCGSFYCKDIRGEHGEKCIH